MAKFSPIQIQTPIGDLMWVAVSGEGKDNSENKDGSKMQKTASLYLKTGSPECKKLIADIDKAWEAYKAFHPSILPATPSKSLGYKVVKQKDATTGAVTETDMTAFNFSTNSRYPAKPGQAKGEPNIIKIYNPKGAEVTEAMEQSGTQIGNTSRGIIFGSAGGYEYKGAFGISLYLTAIQLAKLVKYAGVEVETQDISTEEDDGMGDLTSAIPSVDNTPEV